MKRLLCIESLAGSFENCIRLGIENKIVKELEFLQDRYGTLAYLSKDVKAFELGSNIQHITLPPKTPSWLKNIAYLLFPLLNPAAFKQHNVYYIHNISGCFPAILAKLLFRKKRVIVKYDWNWSFTFRQKYSYPTYLMTKVLEYLGLRYADVVIASTERLKKDVYAITKNRKKKVVVLPNWVDLELFKPAAHKIGPQQPPRLITIGRLDDGKNHMLMLQAIAQLHSQSPEVFIVGQGEKKDELTAFAQQQGMNLQILDCVPNSRLPGLLQRADLFVMTSKYEGLPHVLLEALSCGLPIIGTNVRGINDIVHHRVNGLLCQENPEDIAQAIRTVLTKPRLYRALRKGALATTKDFAFEKIMNKISEQITP